jgi:hypothetical protein
MSHNHHQSSTPQHRSRRFISRHLTLLLALLILGATIVLSSALAGARSESRISATGAGQKEGAATVTYTTSDTVALTNCNIFYGIASSRCDYAISISTLHFAAGETSKTISIPIVDDSYAEGPENFTITLSKATGETLGVITTATITISDNETVRGANPLSSNTFFVRQ